MQGLFNNVKTAMLMALLMGLCLGIGYLIGGPTVMTYALVIGLVMNGFAYFFSDRIALATMRAEEISREDDPALYEMVRMLAERANLPMPRVYVSPASAPNAFATGRNPHHAAVCVTVGLRRMLNDEELAGVVAHELCHVKNRDILISAVATVIASAITYLAYMALWFGGDDDRNPLVALLLVLVAP
ncbi:MAG: M48 family metalloprotease, partial [Planctomycetota bacterium]